MPKYVNIDKNLEHIAASIKLENMQLMQEIKEAYRLGDLNQVSDKLHILSDNEWRGSEPTILSDNITDLANLIR